MDDQDLITAVTNRIKEVLKTPVRVLILQAANLYWLAFMVSLLAPRPSRNMMV